MYSSHQYAEMEKKVAVNTMTHNMQHVNCLSIHSYFLTFLLLIGKVCNIFLMLKQAQCHADMWKHGGTVSRILNFDTVWKRSLSFMQWLLHRCRKNPGTQWRGSCTGPSTGLDIV
jgi:hypothetical protein